MSKDYKIGIVVGFLVLVVGVTYFYLSSQKQQSADPAAVTQEPISNQPVVDSTSPADSTAVPVEVVVVPQEIETPTPADSETIDVKFEDVPSVESVDRKQPTAEIGAGETSYASSDEGSNDTKGNYFRLDEGADTAPEEDPEIVTVTTASKPESVDLSGKSSYVIKENDSLWLIAERVYGPGNGSKYTLIRDANRSINPELLPIGKRLKIPPLQTASSTPEVPKIGPGRPGPAVVGSKPMLTKNAAGQDIYIVSKSDGAGFWGIAKKVYGEKNVGQFQLISKANRNVNPHRLKAGMKLVIPALSKKTVPTAGATSSVYRAKAPVPVGGKIYTVKRGDTIWKIAKGDTKYMNQIIRANRKVDADNLKLGQKLILPPKSKPGAAPPSRPKPVRPRKPISSDEPDFS